MSRHDGNDRWRERPVLGASLQALLTVTPLGLGVGAGFAVWSVISGSVHSVTLAWVVAGVAAMITVWALQPVVRQLVPLAWLLKLGMLWPGQVPSRLRVARRAGRIRDLESRLAHAREHGITGEVEEAAEYILTLATALTAHDRRTRGHAERVRVFTDLLALELGLPRHDRDRLRWAALLHDIGKLEVPEHVLNKPGKPSASEWETLKAHPAAGDRIMAPLKAWLGPWADTTLHHHEWWDGSGYPQGLAGNEISLGGRIVSVADVYDVMTAARSYRRPVSAAKAREELVACSGTQFDPAVVRALLLVPTWRLRWALGPFAWVAQLPLARDAIHTGGTVGAMAPAAGAAAGATVVLMGSGIQPGGVIDDHHPPDRAASGDTTEVRPSPERGEPSDAADDAEMVGGMATVPGRDLMADRGMRSPDRDAAEADARPTPNGAVPRSAVPEAGDGQARQADVGQVVDDTVGTVGHFTNGTAATLGKVVDDTASTAGKVIDDTTSTLGKVIDDTASAAGSVADDPVGSVGKIVDDTASTAGSVIDDTTSTVDIVDDTTGTVGHVVDDTKTTVGRLLGRP